MTLLTDAAEMVAAAGARLSAEPSIAVREAGRRAGTVLSGPLLTDFVAWMAIG